MSIGKCLLYGMVFCFIVLIPLCSNDPFLHFQHMGGWAAHVTDGEPPNHFQCVMIQVYSKFKTRFYKYQHGNDRHGVSVDAERIYNNTINGFAVSFHHTINSILY